MCGIAGFWGVELPAERRREVLRAMCDSLAHRGPDDQGFFEDQGVGLGMRRLSIIDLQTGQQPMYSPDGRYTIIYNGEVYNYRELRPALEQAGRVFATKSDTEVILAQFEHDGPDCVQSLNGMFALAVWDAHDQRLVLARDRLGIKPLYYFWDGARLVFASEIKAILASGLVEAVPNPRAIWDFLTFRYVPAPETIWQGIKKLPPGHTLTLAPGDAAPAVRRYWDMPFEDRPLGEWPEYERQFEELFLDAVNRRLIADVPVGILLSGGLDSSCVAAAVAKLHNLRLNSFSVSFEGSPQTDELPFARLAAQHLGTDHHEVVIGRKEFLDFLPELVYYTDEPLADLASVPLYYVSRLARQRVKVVLSGEGGDEVLAGYDLEQWVHRWDRARRWQRLPAWLHQRLLPRLARRLAPGALARMDALNQPVDQRLREIPPVMTNFMTDAQKRSLFLNADGLPDSLDLGREQVRRVASKDPLHQLLYVFSQDWLVEDLLMKADRMSLANSLELRVPFLDHRLVEWAAQAPSFIKAGRRSDGVYESKQVLRRFARKYVPREIIDRPKMGFPVPVYDWLGGEIKDWAHGLLDSGETRVTQWLQPEGVRAMLAAGSASRPLAMDRYRLWNLLILELWCRRWLET